MPEKLFIRDIMDLEIAIKILLNTGGSIRGRALTVPWCPAICWIGLNVTCIWLPSIGDLTTCQIF